MTKQEAIKLLTNKKVFVKNKSSEIQEKLFSFGIYWYGNLAKVQFEDAPFLYIGMENDILRISHGSNVYTFYEHKFEEIPPEDILNITIDEPIYRPLKEILKQEHLYRPFKEILKQEHLYRPFKDAKECWEEMLKHEPFGWIKHKEKIYLAAIASLDNTVEYKLAFEKYTFADGTPFGLKEED